MTPVVTKNTITQAQQSVEKLCEHNGVNKTYRQKNMHKKWQIESWQFILLIFSDKCANSPPKKTTNTLICSQYQASTWPKTQPQVGQGECDPSNEESPPLATQPFTPDASRFLACNNKEASWSSWWSQTLVGGFNPSENISQTGNLSPNRGKNKKLFETTS